MSLCRARVQVPGHTGALEELTRAAPGVRPVAVHVGQPEVGVIVADVTWQATDRAAMDAVLARLARRSPRVRRIPLAARVDDYMYRLREPGAEGSGAA